MFSVAVAVLLVLSAGVQLWYLGLLFEDNEDENRYAAWYNNIPQHAAQLPPFALSNVSVLICAANEASNLVNYLPAVLEQDYRDGQGGAAFEVIVVDDRSTDDTRQILKRLQETYAHLRIVTIAAGEPRRFPGKKDALSRGVDAAAHDILLMTDADCRPASATWISWMAAPFSKGQEIVAGYGGFETAAGLLNKFIRCETVHTFAQYLGWCRRGLPYMAVGRNLACRKELLLRAQADPIWAKTASGDDDMLIRICATAGTMVVNEHRDSHTYSAAKSSWSDYLRQKQRHMSTGKYYREPVKRRLGVYALSHSLSWVFLLCCLYQACSGSYSFGAIYGWAATVGIVVFLRWSRFSGYLHGLATQLAPENSSLRYFWPIFDVSWMFYNIILSPYILWKSRQRWK